MNCLQLHNQFAVDHLILPASEHVFLRSPEVTFSTILLADQLSPLA
jgi:hypothetical protein